MPLRTSTTVHLEPLIAYMALDTQKVVQYANYIKFIEYAKQLGVLQTREKRYAKAANSNLYANKGPFWHITIFEAKFVK